LATLETFNHKKIKLTHDTTLEECAFEWLFYRENHRQKLLKVMLFQTFQLELDESSFLDQVMHQLFSFYSH